MGRHLLPQTCYCCSLKTGSLIVAYIGATFNLIGLVAVTVFYLGIPEKYETRLQESVFTPCVIVLFIVIKLIVNMMLVKGVRKSRIGFIKTWLCLAGLFFIFGILITIFHSILAPIMYQPEQYFSYVIIWIIQMMHISFFIVVYSFYEQLKFKQKYYNTVLPTILAYK